MATADATAPGAVQRLGAKVERAVSDVGDLSLFVFRILRWTLRPPGAARCCRSSTRSASAAFRWSRSPACSSAWCWPCSPTPSSTQSAWPRASARSSTCRWCANWGRVLAATMLAGRVGGAMAAELATMRITEQIDALACLGANPVHYLAVPRFLACVLLIPLLTIMANFMGVHGRGADRDSPDLPRRRPLLLAEHRRATWSLWDLIGRADQADVLRRRHRHHQLPPRLPQRRRRRGRRPGGDAGVRVVVHRHPGPGLLPGAVPQQPATTSSGPTGAKGVCDA